MCVCDTLSQVPSYVEERECLSPDVWRREPQLCLHMLSRIAWSSFEIHMEFTFYTF